MGDFNLTDDGIVMVKYIVYTYPSSSLNKKNIEIFHEKWLMCVGILTVM